MKMNQVTNKIRISDFKIPFGLSSVDVERAVNHISDVKWKFQVDQHRTVWKFSTEFKNVFSDSWIGWQDLKLLPNE